MYIHISHIIHIPDSCWIVTNSFKHDSMVNDRGGRDLQLSQDDFDDVLLPNTFWYDVRWCCNVYILRFGFGLVATEDRDQELFRRIDQVFGRFTVAWWLLYTCSCIYHLYMYIYRYIHMFICIICCYTYSYLHLHSTNMLSYRTHWTQSFLDLTSPCGPWVCLVKFVNVCHGCFVKCVTGSCSLQPITTQRISPEQFMIFDWQVEYCGTRWLSWWWMNKDRPKYTIFNLIPFSFEPLPLWSFCHDVIPETSNIDICMFTGEGNYPVVDAPIPGSCNGAGYSWILSESQSLILTSKL